MTTYRVEPYDHDDGPGLWRYQSEHDQQPVPVAYLFNGHLACGEPDHGVVFRAAAAVLAPDEALRLRLAEAMFEANGGGSWHALGLGYRDQWVRSAHAALTTLRAHVEGSQS